MSILLALLTICGGLVLLIGGADRLIAGAVGLARRARLSEAVIGATIVAGGTSAPELVASVSGALAGQYGLAVGNVVGSNSFNIGFILGLVALIAPMAVARDIARRDVWVMVVVSIGLVGVCQWPGSLSWAIALPFLAAWAAYVVWGIHHSRRTQPAGDDAVPAAPAAPAWASVGWVAAGIALLTGGGWLLVHGSVDLARMAGIGDAIIGLTIVAAGTSAPELVTSLLAARRGQHQIAVANIVGSNTFNILFILGITGLLGTLPVAEEIRHRDGWVMLAFALLLPLVWWRTMVIGRIGGSVLLAGYLAYLGVLITAVAGAPRS